MWFVAVWWLAAEQPAIPQGMPGWVWAAASAIVTGVTTVLSGKIVVPTFAYNRERDRADRLEGELAASRARELAMAEKMGGEVTTTLLQATQAMTQMAARRRREQ